jgi:hypothetical protein
MERLLGPPKVRRDRRNSRNTETCIDGAERVLVHGDTNVDPELLNSRFACVSISRASLDAKIYTNDAADLRQRLSSEVSKSSAIEFSHSTANAMTDLSLEQGIEVSTEVCCKTSLDMIK